MISFGDSCLKWSPCTTFYGVSRFRIPVWDRRTSTVGLVLLCLLVLITVHFKIVVLAP